MIAVDEYRNWAASCQHLPLFHQPWWLDVVAKNTWTIALAKNTEGKIIGVMPLLPVKKWGIKGYDMPALTPYLGPWYDFPAGMKRANRYALEHELQAQLLSALPSAWFFRQRWHPALVNALGFRWWGYQLGIKYTYCIDLIQGDWEAGFTPALRNNIRNAHQVYYISTATDPGDFYALSEQNFSAQKMKMPYSQALFLQVYEAVGKHAAGTLYWAIRKENGAKEAAILVLRDQQWAYLLASARSPKAHNGAVALLIEQAIKDAQGQALEVFDFEGSSLKGVEAFFRQFGGELKTGLVVKKPGWL